MDLESQQTLDEVVDRVTAKVVPALEAAMGRQLAQMNTDLAAALDRATSELSGISAGALQGIQAIADKAAADLNALVSRVDGVTLKISLPSASKA